MLRRIDLVIASLLSLTLAGTAQSQNGQPAGPIYVVDMQKIIDQSVIGKAARNNIEEDMKKKRLSLEKLKLEIDKAREEIEKQSSLLSAEAIQSKQEQVIRKQRDFERAYADQREQLAKKNQEAMSKVVTEIDEVIKKLAAENNYRMVLEKDARTVAYVNEKYDISDEVIKAVNAAKVGL